jgi:hypothetical protein
MPKLPKRLFRVAWYMGISGLALMILSAPVGGIGICGPTTTIGAILFYGGLLISFGGVPVLVFAFVSLAFSSRRQSNTPHDRNTFPAR